MQNNFENCLAFVLLAEGGFVDNANDPGGATMEGITLATYREYMNDSSITVKDLQHISSNIVATIYDQNYWAPNSCNDLSAGIDLMVFDMDVNAGNNRSAKLLQATIKVEVDGQIGPITLAKIHSYSPSILINSLAVQQEAFYRSLVNFKYFGEGWLNRIHARHAKALSMATVSLPTTAVRLKSDAQHFISSTDFIKLKKIS